MSESTLSNRVALVTGASRRVGRAIALALAERGAQIVVHHRDSASEADEVVEVIHKMGGQAVAIRADLADPAGCRELVDAAAGFRGRLDVLVNSASPFRRLPFVDADDEAWEAAWDEALAVTLRAPARLMRMTAPLLGAASATGGPSGVVVNVLDIAAYQAWPSYAHHGAAKAGLTWLTRTMAVALAPHVRVAGVAPGIVDWPANTQAPERERLLARVPLARVGQPDDVAQAVGYLAGASYVTGTVLVVDGGRLAQSGEGGGG